MATSLDHTPLSLLDRLRVSRDEPDWERFVRVYRDLIRVWLTRAGVTPADLDDLHQDVLLRLLQAVPRFQHNGRCGAFRRWLKTLVERRVLNYARSQHKVLQLPDTWPAGAVGTEPSSDLQRAWEREHDEHVLRSILRLVEPEFTESTWSAFHRQVLRRRPAKVVAEELGLSINAVLIAKSRVLKRLRAEAMGMVE